MKFRERKKGRRKKKQRSSTHDQKPRKGKERSQAKQSTNSTLKSARKPPLNKCNLPLNMWMQTSKFQLTSSEFALSSPLLPLVDNVRIKVKM
jgi:hypothetical protein